MISTDLLSIGYTFGLGVANHLWQSTLFAAAAWLITVFLKKNRARIRYWIWFSVSIKFLIPFSLIVSLGGWIAPEWSETPIEIPPAWNVVQSINQPFNPLDLKEASLTLDIKASPSPSGKRPLIILSLWLCGAFVILINWHKRCMRVSRMVRKAELLIDGHTVKDFHRIKQENRISNTVQLASTQDTMEPSVFGIFRPVLLLPAGILKRVDESELEAIITHEFAHIRCKDNLIAFIHMLVEAFFWFHPVVWWTGSRLVFERERACDESVLQSGKNPQAYAKGILKVCEYYFESPLAYVSGVIGSNLKRRMEGIMKNQIGHKLSLVKVVLLSLAGLSVIGIPLSIGIVYTPSIQAHSFNSDLSQSNVNEYKPGSYEVSIKTEKKNESIEDVKATVIRNSLAAVNTDSLVHEEPTPFKNKVIRPEKSEEQDRDNSMAIPNAGMMPQIESLNISTSKNQSSALVIANAGMNSSENLEKIFESVKTDRESFTNNNVEESVILTQKESSVNKALDYPHISETRAIESEHGSPLEKANAAIKNEDYNMAYQLLQPMAEAKNVEAQTRLGAMYVNGQGVEKDLTKGLTLIMEAANQGYDVAQACALDVSMDMARAGDTGAMYNVGGMCLNGWGGEQDKSVCLKWLEEAVKLGHIGSAEMLNKIHKKGLYGIPRNKEKAAQWKNVAKGFKKGINGRWARVIARNGTEDRLAFFYYELKVKNNKLTGSMRDAKWKKIPIEDGNIDGNHISFKVPMKWDGMDMTHYHTATFLGDALHLSIKTDKGDGSGEGPPLTFAAMRSRGDVISFMGHGGSVMSIGGGSNYSYERLIDHGNTQDAWTGQTFIGN